MSFRDLNCRPSCYNTHARKPEEVIKGKKRKKRNSPQLRALLNQTYQSDRNHDSLSWGHFDFGADYRDLSRESICGRRRAGVLFSRMLSRHLLPYLNDSGLKGT